MANYVGKLVELRTREGTYCGTVCSAEQGKVTLEDVKFLDSDGKSSTLPRIRITRNEVLDQSIRILNDVGNGGATNDPFSMYTQAEHAAQQRLATAPTNYSGRNSRRTTMPANRTMNIPQSGSRSQGRAAPSTSEQWAMEPGNAFPSDEVFELEKAQHEMKLVGVNSVREMYDSFCYCVLRDPNDRNFADAMQLIGSRSFARVGLGIFGSHLSRTTHPAWIAVATPQGVLLFDIRSMNGATFDSCGLAEFMSRPSNVLPRKFMHDSRCAADCLKYYFNVQLKVFCDTLAMKTCIFMRDACGRVPRFTWSLFDLLLEYCPVGKDLDILEHRYNFAQFESDVWNSRPAKESTIHLAVALTVHLCDLYERLSSALMEPVMYATEIMLNSYRNSDSAPFTTMDALLRMPDGVAELAGANIGSQSQYVANEVGTRRIPAIDAYKKGLLRRGMGAFVAESTTYYEKP